MESLPNDLIQERQFFKNGMSIYQLMEKYVAAEKFVDHKTWKTGFCFHGHFFFSYFLQFYHLAAEDTMEALLGSEIRSPAPPVRLVLDSVTTITTLVSMIRWCVTIKRPMI